MKGCATLLSIPLAVIVLPLAASLVTAALGLPTDAWWLVALALGAIGVWCASLPMHERADGDS